ncbi:MAG: DUF4175 family protein [Cytophagales bacterium]
MEANNDIIKSTIKQFRKKLYLKSLYTGLILFLAITVTAFLSLNILEYFGNFNSIVRSIFFWGFIICTCCTSIFYIIIPSYKFITKETELNDIKTAQLMGSNFENVNDKVVNYLQLLNNSPNNNLVIEAIKHKKNELSTIPFLNAIKFDNVFRYLKISLIPVTILLIILLFSPAILSEGSERIVNYQKTYAVNAPFQFVIQNKTLKTIQNEDYTVELKLVGKLFPEIVYLVQNGRKFKMTKISDEKYSFSFKNVQKDIDFNFEASGFSSLEYNLQVIQQPLIAHFEILLNYPSYIQKKNETMENIGNLEVPEGTTITWKIDTKQTDSIKVEFDSKNSIKLPKPILSSVFEFSKKVTSSQQYSIALVKDGINNSAKTNYSIEVIKDQSPSINTEFVQDTNLYKEINIGGNIRDDYGFSALRLFYAIKDNQGKVLKNGSQAIPLDLKNNFQNYIYNWNIDTLQLAPEQSLEYYVQVWDNDAVNGHKSAKSQKQLLKMPDNKAIKEQITQTSNETEKQIESSLNKAEELQREFEKLQNKIKGKKNLDWQDKKSIENYLKKHENLKQEVEKLSELNKNLNEKSEKFSEQELKVAEKAQKLQELIENIMDEETQKMWDQLQKLINEKNKDNEIQDLLNKMDQKDESLEKELDRAMEFYKQLQFDRKLEENISKLEQLAQKQDKLAEEQKDKNILKEQQEQLNKEFEDLKKELNQLNDLNKDLEEKYNLEEINKLEKEAENEMKSASDELNNNNKKQAQKNQKNAAQKMKQMAKSMQKMKQDEESNQKAESIEDLRQILENLLKLSFDQEELLKNMKSVNKSDPKYLSYSQEQLKLKDDAKVIEDSLYALSKREISIEAFINKEVGNMKMYMDESSKYIKKREPQFAASKQQAAMTSINNLALMLDDALKSMQQQQSQQQKQGNGSCNNPNGKGQGQGKGKGKNGQKPSPGQMQRQLSEQMQDLLNGGKSGNKSSEQLAKMAAQQERIRKALQELDKLSKGNQNGKNGLGGKENEGTNNGGKNGNSGGGGQGEQLLKEMDKIEEEIVNKRINPELIQRQKELTTRLLEFENSLRERDMEEKRESNTAKELPPNIPPSLQKYLRNKNKTTENIKNNMPSLNHFYKKKVDEFYQKLNQ